MNIYKEIVNFITYVQSDEGTIKIEGLLNWYHFDQTKLNEIEPIFNEFILNYIFKDLSSYNQAIIHVNNLVKDKYGKVWNKVQNMDDFIILDKFLALLIHYGYIKNESIDMLNRLHHLIILKRMGINIDLLIDYTKIPNDEIQDYLVYVFSLVLPNLEYRIDVSKTKRNIF